MAKKKAKSAKPTPKPAKKSKPMQKKSAPKPAKKSKPAAKPMKPAKSAKPAKESMADMTAPVPPQEAMLPAPEPKLELPAPEATPEAKQAESAPEAPTSPPPAPVTMPEKGDLVLQVKLRKYYISAVKGTDVLLMKDGKTIAQTTTDQAGSAYFRDLTPGAYSLGATYNGKFLTKNVIMKSHTSVVFNI